MPMKMDEITLRVALALHLDEFLFSAKVVAGLVGEGTEEEAKLGFETMKYHFKEALKVRDVASEVKWAFQEKERSQEK